MMTEHVIEFRLYIAGQLPNSLRAVSNLRTFCDTNVSSRYSIEVLDVFEQTEAALADSVFMTPQLLVQAQSGRHIVVGDLSDTSRLAELVAGEA